MLIIETVSSLKLRVNGEILQQIYSIRNKPKSVLNNFLQTLMKMYYDPTV